MTVREQCPCGQTYVGPLEAWRTWVLAHAKHWDEDDE